MPAMDPWAADTPKPETPDTDTQPDQLGIDDAPPAASKTESEEIPVLPITPYRQASDEERRQRDEDERDNAARMRADVANRRDQAGNCPCECPMCVNQNRIHNGNHPAHGCSLAA